MVMKKNNIMFPILIIIFSFLIIFAILNKKNNDKLNKIIDKFENKEENEISKNIMYNTKITKDFANGTWTTSDSVVDSNYNVSNLMVINITENVDGKKKQSYGTVNYNNKTFNITFILDEYLIANDGSLNIKIKFYNKFNNENNINVNLPNSIPNTLNAVVLVSHEDTDILKFVSYKVYQNKVNNEVYKIIKSGNTLIDNPPKLYDFHAYEVITKHYRYPGNLLSISSYNTTNYDTIKILNQNYQNGIIHFSVQRVFYSPSNEEIITRSSEKIPLNVMNNNLIANNIVIAPFSDDKMANNLDTFFKPKATILYFYKFINENITYDYSDKSMNHRPSNVMKFQNNGNSMFKNNIEYNNLLSVEKITNNTYNMTLVGRLKSDLNKNTIFPFSMINNLL